ncbi:hypothetical protein LO80_08505 [Candidatus Francisella endociliophora]|uniref:Bacterial sugar transferase domain-containing protein n=1 Tax=Candidatus Francisella endociliophora TaxID=653937 RepID=A0A097ER05_9GAMM|nr:sugar transferase [Francisella sp. FSC1006]AIT10006.1 hypothetical protein LO80_08505 [Francisella sp. FSC1006]
MPKKTLYTLFLKRVLDFVLSLLALIVLFPVILALAMLVRLKLGSPVIFKQPRPGKNEKVFNLYKFRTMTDARDVDGSLLPDSERLTTFGKFVRSTSLDELPSLINIIKGDMSIVGPRPLLIKDMVFMSDEQRERHLIRPGLTGLAQVSGRNNISWKNKLAYDMDYLKKESFFLDFKVVCRTFLKVVKRSDINRNGTDSDLDLGDYLLLAEEITKNDYDLRINEAVSLLKEIGNNKKV